LFGRGMRDDEGWTTGEEFEVSWRFIARGMPVVAADGAALGRVVGTLGDPDHDIFNGVAFRQGLLAPRRTAAAADIARITTRAVYLRLPAAAFTPPP
jgi:hypothetical protein